MNRPGTMHKVLALLARTPGEDRALAARLDWKLQRELSKMTKRKVSKRG
jgi:hypothetical protein